jgi:hypothetical protein
MMMMSGVPVEPHSTRKQDSIALLGSSPYNDGDNVQPVRHLATMRDSVPDNNNTVTDFES